MILLVMGVFLALTLAVGFIGTRAGSRDVPGFAVAGRSLGAFNLAMLLSATLFSSFVFIGGPGLAFSRGVALLYLVSAGVIGITPLYFLGPRIARLGRQLGYVSQAQLLHRRFPSDLLRLLVAGTALGVSFPFLGLMIEGAGEVIHSLTDGGVSRAAGALVAYGVVVAYVMWGGARALARTSILHGALMFAVVWGLGLYLAQAMHGGVAELFTDIAADRPELLTLPGLAADGSPWGWDNYTSSVIYSAISVAVWPHLFAKLFTAGSEHSVRRAVASVPAYQLILFPVLLIGLAAVSTSIPTSESDHVLFRLVLSSPLPAVFVGLACAGGLAASMSTGDALAHGAAVTAVEDVILPLRRLSERTRRVLMQLGVLVFTALAYLWAVVLHLPLAWPVIFAYGLVIQLAPPIYAALLWRRATTAGAVSGFLAGIGTTLYLFLTNRHPFGYEPGLAGILLNLALMVTISYATPRQSNEHLAQFEL